MRIAVWHNLPSGGGKRALFNHIKALKEAGHYLEAWTTDFSSENYLPLTELIPEHRIAILKNIKAANKIPFPIKRERIIYEILKDHYYKCLREIKTGDFDLIFANSCGITYMPQIGLYTDLPTTLYLGEPYRPLYEAMPKNIWAAPYEKLRLRKIKRLVRDFQRNYANRIRVSREIAAAASYDKILVNSLFSRESVLRAYGIDARVSYLGIDTARFRNTTQTKEAYVVGLGTLSRTKGVHLAIETVARIPEGKRPGLKWIANGAEEGYPEEMNRMAADLKVDYQPYLNLDQTGLTEMLSRAAVMLYTSRLEPFGLAPLEANACGTYVIANAEGGIRESISHGVNGSLIYNSNMLEFAGEVEKFITNLDLARESGMKAREFVRKNWDLKLRSRQFITELEEMGMNNLT